MQILRKFDKSVATYFDEGARVMFRVFTALALIIFIAYQLAAIKFPYSMDYGEAPLVDQAMRLAAGQNIYRADLSTPPYTISNYPPLYIAVLAIVVKLFGPALSFLIGRIISALCAWIASVCIGLIIYRSTRDRLAAFGTACIFVAFPFVMYWSPLLRIDMLALALSLVGLCVLTWQPESPRWPIAALLLVTAIYTRQSYALAAPLAGSIWLLTKDWKQALKFAGLVSGLSLLLFIILNMWTRGGFYFNIVTANANEFRLGQLLDHANRFREIALILLIIGGASFLLPLVSSRSKPVEMLTEPEKEIGVEARMRLFFSQGLNPLWALSTPYLIGSFLSAATIGKIGSNVNYLLELCAAISIAAGAVLAWSRLHLNSYTLRAALLILLALAVGRMMHYSLTDYTNDLRDRQLAYLELNELESLVKETSGPILADEYMGMLTLHGRPLSIQPFEVTQLVWAGKWNQTALINSISEKEYAAIIIYDRPWAAERWTQEMFDVINKSYVLADIVADNRVYLPYQIKSSEMLAACPGALWQLPSDSTLGVQWQDDRLVFFGQGGEGKVPVYAVADGLLWRLEDWNDAVIIQHDDPLEEGQKIWSFYAGMSGANGSNSLVTEEFPNGAKNVPVKASQLLGYQGSWSGNPQWSMWIHAEFGLMRVKGSSPDAFTDVNIINPSPYLGLSLKSETETINMQPLTCADKQ